MKTLKLVKTGKLIQVENGLAHGMIERGEAVLVTKELVKPQNDKMMSKDRSKVKTK